MFSNNERLDITPEQEDLSTFKIFGILDLDKEFHGNPDAKVLNNETLVAKKFSKQFTDAIFSNCDEELGFVPRCQCGATKGTSKIGLRCKICDTVCSSQFIDHLQHVAWIAIPEVMPMVLHPIWYQILRDWTAIDRRNTAIIDIILNPKADIPDSVSKFVTGRGFQYFKDNYKEIISKLLNDCPKTKDKSENPWIERLLTVYGDRMFCRHIPILHSSLHPFKSGGDTLNFADGTPKDMLEAIIDISAETFKYHAISVNWKTANENLFKIYKKIIEYNTNLINLKLGKKEGLLRKHCYGSRIHFSLRAVVVPHDQILPMDEVVLPWGTMVNGLKLPILNFLMNRYHKPFVEAVEQWQTALTAYDPLVDKCISDYIAESQDGCIWTCIGRNPD